MSASIYILYIFDNLSFFNDYEVLTHYSFVLCVSDDNDVDFFHLLAYFCFFLYKFV